MADLTREELAQFRLEVGPKRKLAAVFDMAEAQLAEREGWVKCSDRLPVGVKRVWVHFDCGEMDAMLFNGAQWIWGDGSPYDSPEPITHWQPLPAAPTGAPK